MSKKIFFAFLVLCFSNLIFPYIIYANSPSVGENLQVLVEGAQNQSVLIIAPDGSKYERNLADGQLSEPVGMAGKWIIKIGTDEKEIEVKENASVGAVQANGEQLPFVLIFVFLLLLVFFAMVFAAAFLFIFPVAPKRRAFLVKRREGGKINTKLMAGSVPIFDAQLVDGVGKGWAGGEIKMKSKKINAYECLQVNYEFAGELSSAYAQFLEEGKRKRLEIADGICRSGKERNENENKAGLAKKENENENFIGKKIEKIGKELIVEKKIEKEEKNFANKIIFEKEIEGEKTIVRESEEEKDRFGAPKIKRKLARA